MFRKKITVTITDGKVTCNGTDAKQKKHNTNGRHIYIAGEYVIKVDDRGYNHDDMGTWKRIKKEDREFFVPCLAQGETEEGIRWSVQPYVDLSWDDKDSDAEELVDELAYKYDLQDMHELNWAMHNGQPIIFDYGMD